MSDEFEFTAKLGRIGNQGSQSARSTLDRLKRAAARRRATGAPQRRTGFAGQRFGRGAGIGALSKTRMFSKARRVVVKVHIARGGANGTAGFAKHVSYIGRDGTERDGSASALYDRDQDLADAEAFNARASEDERQFRIIVSPEDGHDIEDMKATTRSLIAQVERDLGESLDWIAGDHHNTAHPHTHIVIRGRQGKDALVIAKDYITHGLRARAQEGLTNELGMRREKDIARGQQRETVRDGPTSIDRVLATDAVDGRVVIPHTLGSAARFDRQLKLARLRHLENLGLATANGQSRWTLKPDWEQSLKSLGRQGDIVRTLARQLGSQTKAASILKHESSNATVWGEVRAIGPGDELRNGRTLILEDMRGQLWSFDARENEMHDLPARGIIALSPTPHKLKPADHVILSVAQANGGIYSDNLHKAMDPSSTSEFRLTHTRRLEALRKAGILDRHADGSWQIPSDYETKVLAYQSKRQGSDKQVRSWLSLDALIEHADAGFLDQPNLESGSSLKGDFAKRVEAARLARRQWLLQSGYLSHPAEQLTPAQIAKMQAEARHHALLTAAANAKRRPVSLYEAGRFTGIYTGHVDLPQGRFAVLQSTSALTLAPYRKGFGAQRGKQVTVMLRGQRLTWQLQRTRGLVR